MTAQVEQIAWSLLWPGGRLPVFVDSAPARSLSGKPCTVMRRVAALAGGLEDRELALGLPLEGGIVTDASVLWCWLESPDSVARAQRFRSKPDIVLRIGRSCRRLVLWTLRSPLPFSAAWEANKRLAYALRAPQKHAAPEELRVPLPGSSLRAGRVNPAPVSLTRLALSGYDPKTLLRGLREPPPRDAWRNR